MSRGNSLSRGLRRASSLKEGAFGMAAKFAAKVQCFRACQRPHPRGRLPPAGGRCRVATKRGIWQSRQALTGGVRSKTPPVKTQCRAVRRPPGIALFINNSSAEYAQSTTTTTAASGGNREELLGQRPARRKCRPRHDADAGCRNPIAERIPIVFLRTAPQPPDAPAKRTAMPRRTGSPP